MPAIRKSWWWARLALLAFATTALGFYLFHSTPWRKALGIQPDYHTQIAEGDRIVQSICDFKYRTQLWPEYLEDAYPAPTTYRWFYELQKLPDTRLPALSTSAPAEGSRAHLAYAFATDPTQGDWHVFTGATDRIERPGPPRIFVTAPAPGMNPLPANLAELDKRIAREPAFLEHRQDKISLLVLHSQSSAAHAALDQAIADFPGSAWPRLARAALALQEASASMPFTLPVDQHLDTLPAPTQEFIDWVAAHPSFTRLYYVCWHLRELADNTRAAAAAAQALTQPIEVDADDTHIAAFYLWDLARWSLETQRWDLAAAICDTWEKAHDAGAVKDESYFALRGAAEVALGKFAAAQADLAQALKADPAWSRAADDAVRHLADAARRKDATARLTVPDEGSACPAPFAVFIDPQ